MQWKTTRYEEDSTFHFPMPAIPAIRAAIYHKTSEYPWRAVQQPCGKHSPRQRGSLWFATEEGLNKFDGIRFLTYYKEETTGKQSITGNELNCLLDDPVDSILWIGTQRAGINAYNYANDSFITYRHNENNPKSLVTDDITKIIAASDGNLWICTYWKGVDYFDKQTGQFTHYNTETVPGLQATISGLP